MAPKLKLGGPLKLDIAPEFAADSSSTGGVPAIDPFSIPEVAAVEHKFKDRDFEYLCELGSGSGGSVAKVRHKATGSIFARKNLVIIVDSEADRKKAEKQLKTELKIVHVVRSEYIVSSYGAFSHEGNVAIVMEYMDLGSLDKIYKQLGPIPEEVSKKMAVHILRGLVYLTENNIVHRDIKPSNILVNTKGQVKITDFGVSKETINSLAKTFTGTPSYLAPERIQTGTDYSVVSDIWSLGLTLIEISTAGSPYGPQSDPFSTPVADKPKFSLFDLMNVIQEQPAPTLPPGKFSSDFENFVATCVIKDYRVRPGPDVLLGHPCCVKAAEDGANLMGWAAAVAPNLREE
ncbi:kinase-like domain-containing protein [Zopfochytrium polystomum]|nr:kinase-like domain-containing protein [Zopfochytrium polystomum]